MQPTIGRIVHYKLSEGDCERIVKLANRPHADGSSPMTNSARPGDVFPAVIVRVWEGSCVNARVLLDGELDLWVTSRSEGEHDGFWQWPPRV